MTLLRREFFETGVAAAALPLTPPASTLGAVHFCRVSRPSLLLVARALYPGCVASYEPRPGFHGITVCGAAATVTLAY